MRRGISEECSKLFLLSIPTIQLRFHHLATCEPAAITIDIILVSSVCGWVSDRSQLGVKSDAEGSRSDMRADNRADGCTIDNRYTKFFDNHRGQFISLVWLKPLVPQALFLERYSRMVHSLEQSINKGSSISGRHLI